MNLPSPLRNIAWRLGRKLYCLARGDLPNDPRANGEYWLLRKIVGRSGREVTLFDIGANKGNWSLHALECSAASAGLRIFAFEPSSATRAILERNTSRSPAIQVESFALSSRRGETTFYSRGAGAGTNSLNPLSGSQSETVQLTTLDAFMEERGLETLTMAKVDTEGYDLDVLEGASATLSAGKIEVVQFEYNWRWLLNRSSLRDVFEFISDKPYRLGKLTREGFELHSSWHFELDRFFEGNYLLVRQDSPLLALGTEVRFDVSNAPVRDR